MKDLSQPSRKSRWWANANDYSPTAKAFDAHVSERSHEASLTTVLVASRLLYALETHSSSPTPWQQRTASRCLETPNSKAPMLQGAR